MQPELTAQHYKLSQRASPLSAPYAKSMNTLEQPPDAAWRALVSNPSGRSIAGMADLPVNAIAGWLALDDVTVGTDAWKSIQDRAVMATDARWLALLTNSDRPALHAGVAAPVHMIADVVERKARP